MTSLKSQIQTASPRNEELHAILEQTANAHSAAQQQNTNITEIKKDLAKTQSQLKVLEVSRAKEFKEHKSLRDSKLRRFAYKVAKSENEFVAKAAKEEEEYLQVLQEEQKVKEQERHLEHVQDEALLTLEQYNRDAEKNETAQAELESLYDSIFVDPTPDFQEQDDLKTLLSQDLKALQEVRTKEDAENRALKMLRQAQDCVSQAQRSVDKAIDYSRRDMVIGSPAPDMKKRNALKKAQTFMSQANTIMTEASQISPSIKDIAAAQIAQRSLAADVLFDNIFTRVKFHDKIKSSKADLQLMKASLQTEVSNSTKRLESLKSSAETNSKQVAISRFELQKSRERIFEQLSQPTGLPTYTE